MVTAADTHRLLKTLDTALQPRAEILEAYLFGSAATGATHPHRDVDIAVYLAERQLADTVFEYAADLAAALMSALGTDRVDVVVLNLPRAAVARTDRAGGSGPAASGSERFLR